MVTFIFLDRWKPLKIIENPHNMMTKVMIMMIMMMIMMVIIIIACLGAGIQREQEKPTERKQAGEVRTHYEK